MSALIKAVVNDTGATKWQYVTLSPLTCSHCILPGVLGLGSTFNEAEAEPRGTDHSMVAMRKQVRILREFMSIHQNL